MSQTRFLCATLLRILFGFRQNMTFPLLTVGFEPTTTRLRASRSTDWARQAVVSLYGWSLSNYTRRDLNPRSTKHGILSATPLTKLGYWCIMHIDDALSKWSVRGSNPRLCAHKTHTLPTELTDLSVSLFWGRLLSFAPGGIWTREAYAWHLECHPFDQTREPVLKYEKTYAKELSWNEPLLLTIQYIHVFKP